MASWSEFAADEPRLADGIRALLQQYGPGFGYLATVRADGGPRVHPVSPVITDEGLFCFIIDSPKRRDLERDGRYALHSFPPEESDDEAYLAGRARPVTDPVRVARLAGAPGAPPRRSTGGCSSSPSTPPRVRRHGPGGALRRSPRPPLPARGATPPPLARRRYRRRRPDTAVCVCGEATGSGGARRPRAVGRCRGRLPPPGPRIGYSGAARGCSSMAEHQLPKLTVRVRFPSPAPRFCS